MIRRTNNWLERECRWEGGRMASSHKAWAEIEKALGRGRKAK
jgi:hypothetical protein